MTSASVLILTSNAALACSLERLLSRSRGLSICSMAQPPADELTVLNRLVESSNPIILLVMRMPAIEDLTIIQQLRKQFPEVRIIAILTDDADDYISMTRLAGASECIAQGDLTSTLIPAVLRQNQERSGNSLPGSQS